jgi:trimeric autotransporter adhesin
MGGVLERLFLFVLVLLMAGCGGGGSNSTSSPGNQNDNNGSIIGDGSGVVATLERIEVNPDPLFLNLGETRSLSAAGIYSDGSRADLTEQVAWEVSLGELAQISNAPGSCGHLCALKSGQAVVYAKLGDVLGMAGLTVSPAPLLRLEIEPLRLALPKGGVGQLILTGIYSDGARDLTPQAEWSTSNPALARVDNGLGGGQVYAVAPGSATISASYSGLAAAAEVTITPAVLRGIEVTPGAAQLPLGLTQEFRAAGTYSDGTVRDITAAVAWSCADGQVARIEGDTETPGQAKALAVGQTEVIASLGGLLGRANLEVTAALLQALEITPANSSLPVGVQDHFKAYGHYSDGATLEVTGDVLWSSSDPEMALVSNAAASSGQVTAMAPGLVTLSAALDGLQASATLTVTEAILLSIQVTPAKSVLPPGLFQRFKATGLYSDGKTLNLTDVATWSSSDPVVASTGNFFGERGVVTAKAAGKATITAAVQSQEGSAQVTVTTAWPLLLKIIPDFGVLPPGIRHLFRARCLFSDGSIADVTDLVGWSTGAEAVATVEKLGERIGEVSTRLQGVATIEAAWNDLKATTALTVKALDLELSRNRVFPLPGLWDLVPLAGACEDEVCIDFSQGSISFGDHVVHGQYRLRAVGAPFILRARAMDLNGVTAAWFGGLPAETVLQPGEEIVFTIESGLTGGAEAKLQWNIVIDGLSEQFLHTTYFNSN